VGDAPASRWPGARVSFPRPPSARVRSGRRVRLGRWNAP